MDMLKIGLLKNLTLLLVEDDEELKESIKETLALFFLKMFLWHKMVWKL